MVMANQYSATAAEPRQSINNDPYGTGNASGARAMRDRTPPLPLGRSGNGESDEYMVVDPPMNTITLPLGQYYSSQIDNGMQNRMASDSPFTSRYNNVVAMPTDNLDNGGNQNMAFSGNGQTFSEYRFANDPVGRGASRVRGYASQRSAEEQNTNIPPISSERAFGTPMGTTVVSGLNLNLNVEPFIPNFGGERRVEEQSMVNLIEEYRGQEDQNNDLNSNSQNHISRQNGEEARWYFVPVEPSIYNINSEEITGQSNRHANYMDDENDESRDGSLWSRLPSILRLSDLSRSFRK
jgi:hypothetical protein